MNPYTWLLYTNMDADVADFSLRKAVTGGCDADILHVHWPETLLNQHSLPIAAAKASRVSARCISPDVSQSLGNV